MTSEIERYAERFAAELLMPWAEFCRQVDLYKKGGQVSFEDALRIANHFGVSFAACLNRLAYDAHVIGGDIEPQRLKQRRADFKPDAQRENMGMTDVNLYEQLFDAGGDLFKIDPTDCARQRFLAEYIYHDSRMEGVDIDRETASEIVVDLRIKKQASKFCKADNKNIIEVAGLTLAYDYVFKKAKSNDKITIDDLGEINGLLYSTAVFPEYAGGYRQANTIVYGSGFETPDYRSVAKRMADLGDAVEILNSMIRTATFSDYVERVLDLHHKITALHPFQDGNGRTSRAYVNLMFMRMGLPPVLLNSSEKSRYKNALAEADRTSRYDKLYVIYYQQMLQSYAVLTDNAL